MGGLLKRSWQQWLYFVVAVVIIIVSIVVIRVCCVCSGGSSYLGFVSLLYCLCDRACDRLGLREL